MSDVVDRIRLREIEERLEAATPGPWTWDEFDAYLWGPNMEMVADAPDGQIRMRGVGAKLPIKANAALIANAPADILWLIDRLKKEME